MSYTIEHNGKKITLPAFTEMPVGVIRKARKANEDEAMWMFLEEFLDDAQLAIIDSMTLKEFTEAMKGWTQGAPLGESSESSKS